MCWLVQRGQERLTAVPGGANLVSYAALLWPLFSQCAVYLDLLTVNEVQIIVVILTMKKLFLLLLYFDVSRIFCYLAEQVSSRFGFASVERERACHPCLLQRRLAAWPALFAPVTRGHQTWYRLTPLLGKWQPLGEIPPATLLVQTLPAQHKLLSRAHSQRYQPEEWTLEVFLMVWSLPSVFWIGRCRFLLEIMLFHPSEL